MFVSFIGFNEHIIVCLVFDKLMTDLIFPFVTAEFSEEGSLKAFNLSVI